MQERWRSRVHSQTKELALQGQVLWSISPPSVNPSNDFDLASVLLIFEWIMCLFLSRAHRCHLELNWTELNSNLQLQSLWRPILRSQYMYSASQQLMRGKEGHSSIDSMCNSSTCSHCHCFGLQLLWWFLFSPRHCKKKKDRTIVMWLWRYWNLGTIVFALPSSC